MLPFDVDLIHYTIACAQVKAPAALIGEISFVAASRRPEGDLAESTQVLRRLVASNAPERCDSSRRGPCSGSAIA
jgi:hypothetical protein